MLMGTSRLSHCAFRQLEIGQKANARGHTFETLAALSAKKNGASLAGTYQPPVGRFEQVLVFGCYGGAAQLAAFLGYIAPHKTLECSECIRRWPFRCHGSLGVRTGSTGGLTGPTFSSGTKSGAAKFSNPSSTSDTASGAAAYNSSSIADLTVRAVKALSTPRTRIRTAPRVHAAQFQIAPVASAAWDGPFRRRAAPWFRNPGDAGRTTEARLPLLGRH